MATGSPLVKSSNEAHPALRPGASELETLYHERFAATVPQDWRLDLREARTTGNDPHDEHTGATRASVDIDLMDPGTQEDWYPHYRVCVSKRRCGGCPARTSTSSVGTRTS